MERMNRHHFLLRFARCAGAALVLLLPIAAAAEAEVDADEYAVYAGFLSGGPPIDRAAFPPDFADVWRARAVDRHTGVRRELDAGALRTIHRELGDIEPALLDDYRARSTVAAAVPKRLQEHGVRVLADDAEFPGVDPKERPSLGFGTLRFSRVGFNAVRDRALFHVYLAGGGPSLGYFVAMAKADDKWLLRKAALTEYIIH